MPRDRIGIRGIPVNRAGQRHREGTARPKTEVGDLVGKSRFRIPLGYGDLELLAGCVAVSVLY